MVTILIKTYVRDFRTQVRMSLLLTVGLTYKVV
jgi:hypothetical protein